MTCLPKSCSRCLEDGSYRVPLPSPLRPRTCRWLSWTGRGAAERSCHIPRQSPGVVSIKPSLLWNLPRGAPPTFSLSSDSWRPHVLLGGPVPGSLCKWVAGFASTAGTWRRERGKLPGADAHGMTASNAPTSPPGRSAGSCFELRPVSAVCLVNARLHRAIVRTCEGHGV